MQSKKILKIKKNINKLILISKKNSKKYPLFVILAMHELFRNLYPHDPYIKKNINNHVDNLLHVVNNLILFIQHTSKFGSYLNQLNIKKYNTQTLFGKLWKERLREKKLDSDKVLEELLKKAKINKNHIKNKNVLDMGCGSGRFTIALAKQKTKFTYGVDLGDEGLKIGKLLAKNNNIKNIKFLKSNVLNLPFKNSSFDFIFCKGVLHHTGNTFKGLKELHRVLKPGGRAFIYLYGKRGIFWNTRKLMRQVMRNIPMEYTIDVLKNFGMPSRRTIFVDSWYVPVEEHIDKKKLEDWFKKNKISFTKYKKAKKTELEYYENKYKNFYELFGNGELRYTIQKND